MKNKEIVFCTDSLDMGGIEKALINLTKYLIEDKKYDIKICIKDYEKNFLEKDISKGIEYKYMTRPKKNQYFFRILEKMHEFKNFKEFIKDSDVIIDYYDGNFNKWFSKIKNKERIIFIHTLLEKTHIFDRNNITQILKNSYDKYVVLSDAAKQELINYGIAEEKIFKIYNIIDFEYLKKMSVDRKELSQEDEELIKKPYYVMVGRVVNNSKDYDTVIEAFKNLDEKLYIIGSGPYLEELTEKVKKNGMEDRVILLGLKKNPYIWIKNSKALIMSSKYEGLPTVILEALTLNKSVIASDCPHGVREILQNEKYGKIFPVGDVEKLREKILIEDKEQDYSERLKDFSSEKIKQDFYKMLEKI
ncbi:MAG: glycosyltransferase [Fusobacteriaceae bacterium]